MLVAQGLAMSLDDPRYKPLVWGTAILGVVVWLVLYDERFAKRFRPWGRSHPLVSTLLACLAGATLFGTMWQWFLRISTDAAAKEVAAATPSMAPPVSPFRLGIRTLAVCDAEGRITLFMVGYRSMYGNTASPVFCLANTEIVNTREHQVVVDRYSMEVSDNPDGPWLDLIPIPLRSSELYALGISDTNPRAVIMPNGTYRLSTPLKQSDMAHAALMRPEPTLESELAKAIEPHQTIAGWAAFDLPRKINKAVPNFLRITVRDTLGVSFSRIVEIPRGALQQRQHDAQASLLEKAGPVVDISGFYRRYYSDRYPRRLKRKR